MKKLFLFAALTMVLAFSGINVMAQCDRNTASPIRCGFYDEGFEDGVKDARGNQSSDYRRYRSKYVSQYESFYSRGYETGYESVRPTVRWTNSQRSAYNSGYTLGQDARRAGGGRRDSPQGNRYDQSIALYFEQGYEDGFANRPRTYDVPVGQGPNYPPTNPGGGQTGSGSWGGRVDDIAEIIIRGNNIRSQDVSGSGLQVAFQNLSGTLPRRPVNVTARKVEGRGNVIVSQQPTRANDFTAIIKIVDPRSGADDYRIDIAWEGSQPTVDEPYRSGSVRWRGRVDQTANIAISGGDVQTTDVAGTGLSNVSFNLTGYLAGRSGSVTARKRDGRGTVSVLQQPSWNNGYTAIVQVFDPSGGSDDYEIDITW